MTKTFGKRATEIMNLLEKSKSTKNELFKKLVGPISHRMNYNSISKNVFSSKEIFCCERCGMQNDDKNYVHSNEECVVNSVLEE